jgi:hypothetical protein
MGLGRICQVAINEGFAPPRQAGAADEGMIIPSGIMLLNRLGCLGVGLGDWGGPSEKDRRMEDGGEPRRSFVARLYREGSRRHTPGRL